MLASPGLPSFDYIKATSASEVTALLLQSNGQARLFMGGTDIFVRMRLGTLAPQTLIDVKSLPGMRQITFAPETGLTIGAAVDMNTLARHPAVVSHYPLLAEAAGSVASYQLRNRATLGGNLCNASPAADTAPAVLVLEAKLILHGPKGERAVPATQFFLGPGKTAMQSGEFLLRIDLPVLPAGAAGRYLKLGRNTQGDLAIVGVAAFGYPDPTAASGYRFRLALASVAPTPIRVPEAEAILAGAPLTPAVIEAAAVAAMNTAQPISDVRASAAYRRAMTRTITRRAIDAVMNVLFEEVTKL